MRENMFDTKSFFFCMEILISINNINKAYLPKEGNINTEKRRK